MKHPKIRSENVISPNVLDFLNSSNSLPKILPLKSLSLKIPRFPSLSPGLSTIDTLGTSVASLKNLTNFYLDLDGCSGPGPGTAVAGGLLGRVFKGGFEGIVKGL